MTKIVYLMVDSSRGSWTTPGVSGKFKALKIAVKFIKTHWAVTTESRRLKLYLEQASKDRIKSETAEKLLLKDGKVKCFNMGQKKNNIFRICSSEKECSYKKSSWEVQCS